jgi:large subunit ribosomal protein L3
MTQIFDKAGIVHPATVILAGPVVVTDVKDEKKDGYRAIQVGFGEKRIVKSTKAEQGHLKGLGAFRVLREFRPPRDANELSVTRGDRLDVAQFTPGDIISVSAKAKGKGFQGVVKRHGFHGGPRSHGQKHSEREPGSIGATGPQKVLKGTRMAGRMGGNRVTVKNLRVLQVDPDRNLLVVSGAVPGRRGTLVEVRG